MLTQEQDKTKQNITKTRTAKGGQEWNHRMLEKMRIELTGFEQEGEEKGERASGDS